LWKPKPTVAFVTAPRTPGTADTRTELTSIMYRRGGIAYVYLIYGLHALFNIVTNEENKPDAVLIRAIEPFEGVELMLRRMKKTKLEPDLTNGPGKLTRALGIDLKLNGLSLTGDRIWIEDRGIRLKNDQIAVGKRIGIDYAGEDALRPWRFWIKDNPFVSKKSR